MGLRDIALPEEPPTAAEAEPAMDAQARYTATDREAYRQLALGLVHEMNNVLGGIAVLSEIYQACTSADDGLTEGLGLIHKSTGRLQTLVAHLKILNDPAAGEPTYFNLSETVPAWFEMFAPLLPKTLALEMTVPAEELAVHLDEAILRRVLLNLTLNLRDQLDQQPDTKKKLGVSIRRRGDTVELTLATGGSFGTDKNSVGADARARIDDAHQCLRGLDGTLIAHANSEFVLELPLIS